MKKIIILMLISIGSLNAFSQEYTPFPTEGVDWYVLFSTMYDDTLLIHYTIQNDTTINNIEYSKLCMKYDNMDNSGFVSIGGLREENQKVYYIGSTITFETEGEYLLYDFTKQIGDTIKHDESGAFSSVVLDIDSVLMGGSYRKRFKVNNNSLQSPDYIVEGIGSIKNGLLGHISEITTNAPYWENICVRKNDILIYLNSNYASWVTNVSEVERIKLNIYPNPAQDFVYINLPDDVNVIEIYDLKGKLLKFQHPERSNQVSKISISGLTKGIYFIKAGRFVRKLVKQ